jgi:hypothetical protein
MRSVLAGLSVVVAGLALAAPLVKRDMVAPLEAGFKDRLVSRQMEILALPRALYVEGVGVVLTADVSLTYAPMINPFQLTIPKEVQEKNHETRLRQLPVLLEEMRQTLLNASVSLDTMPLTEKIILGVTIGHQSWENTAGLPSQIVMQGERGRLMDAKLGKSPPDTAIRVQEQ